MRRISFVAHILPLLLLGAAPQIARGFDSANMDPSVNPCADFCQYAAGAWEKRTAIPAGDAMNTNSPHDRSAAACACAKDHARGNERNGPRPFGASR